MNYHKIKNVEKTVCTCEQKIAYNVALQNVDLFQKQYKAQVVQIHKADIAHEFVQFCMKCVQRNEKICRKYDIDAIFCALRAGAEDYLASACPVLSSYDEIGKMFPANYL